MQISKTSLQYISYDVVSSLTLAHTLFHLEVGHRSALPCPTCTSCLPLAGDATCVTPDFAQPWLAPELT